MSDATSSQQTLQCPKCGCEGLDGMGMFTQTKKLTIPNMPTVTEEEYWYRYHCPDCDEIFATQQGSEVIDQ